MWTNINDGVKILSIATKDDAVAASRIDNEMVHAAFKLPEP